ncbi:MAG: Crp/Fnr family transcriptional regulator [bacterium]|jgi:CRP/FNR family transcriptional regulator|nr:Crp/Fnr family transcriptional regulator [Betaproteobacteria bacterium]
MSGPIGVAVAEELRAAYPVLAGLPAESFDALVDQARLLEVPAGTLMFDDHAACEAMPFLLEGAIRVSKVSSTGREILLYRVHAGEACVLTSGCLVGRTAYSARGVVEREARLVAVPEPVFRRLVAGDESFRTYVFSLFSARLGELMALVEAVAFQRLDQRLAALLLGRGRVLQVTHQSIADELGSVREIVTRLLHHFADDGLVRLSRERIEILDPVRLRAVASAAG